MLQSARVLIGRAGWILVLVAGMASSGRAGELVQRGKFEADPGMRHHEAAACAFHGDRVDFLMRTSDSDYRNVAFVLRQLDGDGKVREETTLAAWEPNAAAGVGLACGLFPEWVDPATRMPGLVVSGRLRPGGDSTLQRYRRDKTLEWTERLPGGELTVYLDSRPYREGFLLGGLSGTSGVVVAVDRVGQKKWSQVTGSRTRTSRVMALSDDSVITLTHSFEKRGPDNGSRLTLVDSTGHKVKEALLDGTAGQRRANPLTGEILDDSWLVGPWPDDQVLVIKAQTPAPGRPVLVSGEFFDSTLKSVGTIDLQSVVSGWSAVHSAQQLNETSLVLIGEHEQSIAVAVVSREGRRLAGHRAAAPPGTYGTKAWTDEHGQLALFVDRLQRSSERELVRFGTLYLFRWNEP